MFPNRFVIEWDGKVVGIDSNSGGYPYKTDSPGSAKFFRTRKEAEHYIGLFTTSLSLGFYGPMVRVVEIQFKIVG